MSSLTKPTPSCCLSASMAADLPTPPVPASRHACPFTVRQAAWIGTMSLKKYVEGTSTNSCRICSNDSRSLAYSTESSFCTLRFTPRRDLSVTSTSSEPRSDQPQ